jgi:hypothetical protein
MSKPASVLTLIFVLAIPNALADRITPSNRVTSRVLVRESPSTVAPELENSVGQTADLITSVPNWYKIRLSDGTDVSSDVFSHWTVSVTETGAKGPAASVVLECARTPVTVQTAD